jgi:hypothetical protein
MDPSTGYCSECQTYEIGNCRSGRFHHPTCCIHTTPEIRYVGFIGAAGTGVGSRLKGNFRLGGGRIREQHRQFGTIVITDEYMSSQRCCYCFRKTRPGRSRRIVDSVGTQKLINLHGAKESSNSTCPAFRIGYTTRPRDTQACVYIGISGLSALRSKEPISPFQSVLRPYERQLLSLDHKPVVLSQVDQEQLPKGV